MAQLSPNQEAKRAQIVAAAQRLLVRDGRDGCTARALADEAGVSRSAFHYYFDSMDEVVDAAMEAYLDAFVGGLRDEAGEHDDPVERFWAVCRRYLESFDTEPGLVLLWWDFSIAAVQAGHKERVEKIETALLDVLRDVVADCGVEDAGSRAEALVSYMIGTSLRHTLHPIGFEQVRIELASLSGITLPVPN